MSGLDIKSATFVKAAIKLTDMPNPPRPTVVFAGRSNVGKSSLINCLTRVKGLARTSSTPGRTQEIIYFVVNEKFYFVDLPGYGYAKVPGRVRKHWGPMIERFIEGNEDLRAVVLILDARRDPSPEDLQLIEWLESLDLQIILAVTKCDKLKKSEMARNLAALRKSLGPGREHIAFIPFSSETRLGRMEVLGAVFDALRAAPTRQPVPLPEPEDDPE